MLMGRWRWLEEDGGIYACCANNGGGLVFTEYSHARIEMEMIDRSDMAEGTAKECGLHICTIFLRSIWQFGTK